MADENVQKMSVACQKLRSCVDCSETEFDTKEIQNQRIKV